ncbi:MAG: hypothetical protein GF419_10250 [Ignavibacteriales bacterium]|nr:hypothetical protein [Ignavibacteriales bacterium]
MTAKSIFVSIFLTLLIVGASRAQGDATSNPVTPEEKFLAVYTTAVDNINLETMKALFLEYGNSRYANQLVNGMDYEEIHEVMKKSRLTPNIRICEKINKMKQTSFESHTPADLHIAIETVAEYAIDEIDKEDAERRRTIQLLRKRFDGLIVASREVYETFLIDHGYEPNDSGKVVKAKPDTQATSADEEEDGEGTNPLYYVIPLILLAIGGVYYFLDNKMSNRFALYDSYEERLQMLESEVSSPRDRDEVEEDLNALKSKLASLGPILKEYKTRIEELEAHLDELERQPPEPRQAPPVAPSEPEEETFAPAPETYDDESEDEEEVNILPMIIKYSDGPEVGGYFLDYFLRSQKTHNSLYKISINPSDPHAATLEIVEDNPDAHRIAINSPYGSLKPACQYDSSPPQDAARIVQVAPGALKKVEEQWQVVTKVEIDFE